MTSQDHIKYQFSWSNRSWDKRWFNQMLQENEALLDTWPNAFYFILWTKPYPKILSSLTQVFARFYSNQVWYVVIVFAEITVLVNQSRREARHWFNFKSFAFCLSFYICNTVTTKHDTGRLQFWPKGCLEQEPNSDELKNVVNNHFSRNRNMIHFSEFIEQHLLRNLIFILVPSFISDYQFL